MARAVIWDVLLGFLQSHPNEKWRPSELSDVLGYETGPIQAALNRIRRENKLGAATLLKKEAKRYNPAWCWEVTEPEPIELPAPTSSSDLQPATANLRRWLTPNPNLPERVAWPAKLAYAMAVEVIAELPEGPELTAGLRKLLEAKDCFVRAALSEDEQ